MKTHARTVLLMALALIVVSSILIHPFGAIKAPGPNKPLLLDSGFDPRIAKIIVRSCQDCHSENTQWPWYSYVAPMSWMVENDVQRGRSRMNLSRWDEYPLEKQREILGEISALVRNRAMPLPRYLLLHPDARLSSDEVAHLQQWSKSERKRLKTIATAVRQPEP